MDFADYIEEIREIDAKIHEVIEESLADLARFLSNSKFPKTGTALIMLLTKSNFIKNGIYELCSVEDLYSVNILYRSLIEHFLKHQYIFLNFAKSNNDQIGTDYYSYCDMGENLDYLKAIRSTNTIFDPSNSDIEVWEELVKHDKRFKGISPKKLKEKNDQFRYKNIIRYISSLGIEDNGTLKKIIPQYSELSSFVHGGPYSENILFEKSGSTERIEIMKNTCEMTFSIAKSIKAFTYLFAYQLSNEYGSYYNKIQSIKLDLRH